MVSREIDIQSWDRLETFKFFRSFQNPHFALTSRIDVTHLVNDVKPRGISAYRACLYSIGAGIHAVPELLTRFRGETVVRHDAVELSMTVPLNQGGFGFAYVPFRTEFSTFDNKCKSLINSVAEGSNLPPNSGERDDLIYLSCLPWLDFTSLNNAIPSPNDCIPRVSWGKFVKNNNRWDMAVAIEVNHALVDGEHLGKFFTALQDTLYKL